MIVAAGTSIPRADAEYCPSRSIRPVQGSQRRRSLVCLDHAGFYISPDMSVLLRYPHVDQCASKLPSAAGTGALLEVRW
jgi:hypothetical protein